MNLSLLALPLFLIALFLVMRGFNPFTNQQREIAKGDKQLIMFAKNLEGLLPEQQEYIDSMGRQLLSHNQGYSNNITLFQAFAFITVSANYISVGITGSGYIPCDQAKSLSFSINLLAALLAGLAQLFLFDKNAQNNLIAGSRLRWEFWQFIGSSQEYLGMEIGQRYSEFTKQTDRLIGDDLTTQQNLHTASKAAKGKTKDDLDKINKAEEGRQ
jgi:hypothetical protein